MAGEIFNLVGNMKKKNDQVADLMSQLDGTKKQAKKKADAKKRAMDGNESSLAKGK